MRGTIMRISTNGSPVLREIANTAAASYRALLQADATGDTRMDPAALHTVAAMIQIWGVPVLEIDEDEAERTWLWSDLHFEDHNSVSEMRRPFRRWSTHDEALKRHWRRHVRAEDTVIHGGDFAPECVNERQRKGLLEALPGTKINILGNHDIRSVLTPLTEGWSASYGAMVLATTPPLVITHCPLRTVPAGTVNVHGHMHRRRDRTEDAHINVAVEQTEYQPISAATIIEEARRRLAGEAAASLGPYRRSLEAR